MVSHNTLGILEIYILKSVWLDTQKNKWGEDRGREEEKKGEEKKDETGRKKNRFLNCRTLYTSFAANYVIREVNL